MKKTVKSLLILLAMPLFIVGVYFLIVYLFTLFPKVAKPTKEASEEIYILYSPIHSDIVLNINDINRSYFPEFKRKKSGYLAFGWGDKETYLTTPNSNDFKLSTSLKALFLNTPSLMHVSYIYHISDYQYLKPINLSTSQKTSIEHTIMQTFSSPNKLLNGYGREDFFYEAKGNYNLINTCNTWTGDRLREANITMPYWTPISSSVISN